MIEFIERLICDRCGKSTDKNPMGWIRWDIERREHSGDDIKFGAVAGDLDHRLDLCPRCHEQVMEALRPLDE